MKLLTGHGIDLPFSTQPIRFHDQTEDSDSDCGRQREGWSAGRADVPRREGWSTQSRRSHCPRLDGWTANNPNDPLRASWEYLRGTYWAVPSAMSVGAVLLSIGMIQVDQAATARLLNRLSWVYARGPEGARAVLSTMAPSRITVAGVTFSITIVALTLASHQFGPRLLRNFLRGFGNQAVLGTFASTYLYCLWSCARSAAVTMRSSSRISQSPYA